MTSKRKRSKQRLPARPCMRRTNEGAIKLRHYLIKTYGSSTNPLAIMDFAKKIGASLSGVRKWLYGNRRPERTFFVKIRKLTGITDDDWYGTEVIVRDARYGITEADLGTTK